MDSNVKLNKDEALQMIRHGANFIFSSKDSTVLDGDIDAILKKGEEKVRLIKEEAVKGKCVV